MEGNLLDGLIVLDFTRAFAGPLCTMVLAEMGAEVWKVEQPQIGDETRTWPPNVGVGGSGYFSALNRSKKSITLNLKSAEGLRIAHELISRADIVIENFTPGVMEKLGLGYPEVSKINPSCIYCSISGFGQSGPYRNRKGYYRILQAMGGLMGATGEKGGGPVKTMVPVADISAGIFSCTSILAALYKRLTTQKGCYIDLSMLDVMVSMLTVVGGNYLHTGSVPPRSGTENPLRVPSAAFLCSDQR